MKLKLTSIFIVCGLAVSLLLGAPSAAPKLTTLESYHKWLQGGWGQINIDGSVVKMRGCEIQSTSPDALQRKLTVNHGISLGFFYHGAITFGVMDSDLHVISNYTSPDYMFKKPDNFLRKSTHQKLVLTPSVDKKGFVIFNFDQDILGLANLHTIVPLTNHSFKLVAKADDPHTASNEYYFKRCEDF